jgi:DNA-binding transcriptional LysR family regulator
MENKPAFNLIIFFIILSLTACGQPLIATPPPTPQIVTVAHTPTLRPAREALHDCAITLPEIALVVQETSRPHLLEEAADLYLWMGEPPDTTEHVYPIASEQIVVIVHPDNPIVELETNILRAIFTGRTRNWVEVGGLDSETEVWVYPMDDEIQQLIDHVLLNGETYTSLAWLAPDSDAMQDAINENIPSIGFLPRAWLTDQSKVIKLTSELQESLHQPILLLSSDEPQGSVRSLVHCMQSETGQATLAERYKVLIE